ncbi:MAG: iron-containing alcohol dehydrogenase [Dehalococcoidales bacterium]|nr:iron-containing alcohol dehydrogenase [Dehalococcoidales bacterium]
MSPEPVSMHTFIAPKQIVWGRGSVQSLETIRGKRALIITDKAMVQNGAAGKIESYVKKAGLACRVFDGVEPEFSFEAVAAMMEKNREFEPDVVIGLGGGSALDSAKAFRVYFEHPEFGLKDIFPLTGPPLKVIPPLEKTTFVAIPTTSGTGSEVSPALVVSDTASRDKRATHSPFLLPEKAVLDPDLADTMPRAVRVDSGFDALSHAIPSYYSRLRNDFSQANAMQAIRLVLKYLEPAVDGGKEAREHLHYAASLAGMAFCNCSLGVEHYIAHIYGAVFHISHGRACAIVLPHAIRFNASAAGDSILEMAAAAGYASCIREGAAGYLIKLIEGLKKHLGVPANLKEQGIPENTFTAELPGFIEKFKMNPNLPPLVSNPETCTPENIRELFLATYSG